MSSNANSVRNRFALALVVGAVLVMVAGGYTLWSREYGSVWTDDAQVDGHVHPINSRVGGTVVWVNPGVDDTKFVQAGTVLARLDTNDYSPTVERLEGDVQAQEAQLQSAQLSVPITKATAFSKLAAAQVSVKEAEAELSSSKDGVEAAQAQVQQAQANARRAEADRERYNSLVNSHEISRSEYDSRMADANVSAAQVQAAEANLRAAQQLVEVAQQHVAARKQDVIAAGIAPESVETARTSVGRVTGELERSQAALRDARLNLSYTEITAPVSGIIGRRSVETGQRLAPGQLLLNIVPLSDIWVSANFKDTQLRRIQPGCHVTVHVDSYKRDLLGTVESIGGATGSKYALIAPDNATGNYIKVVQRIPVRIRLDEMNSSGRPLLPGMSVEVRIKQS